MYIDSEANKSVNIRSITKSATREKRSTDYLYLSQRFSIAIQRVNVACILGTFWKNMRFLFIVISVLGNIVSYWLRHCEQSFFFGYKTNEIRKIIKTCPLSIPHNIITIRTHKTKLKSSLTFFIAVDNRSSHLALYSLEIAFY